jgi:hypothetical protein
MPEVLVDERTCAACGVGVRPESQYCYNCGEEIDGEVSGADRPIERPDLAAETEKPILMPTFESKDSAPVSRVSNTADGAKEKANEPLEPASSLRRRTRVMERKPLEIVWEPAGGPNVVLIISTILLVIFAAVVITLALYYR